MSHEQHVLSIGFQILYDKLVDGKETQIVQLDVRGQMWSRPALIDRLLRGKIQLHQIPAYEVGAAQSDLARLSLEQLLIISLTHMSLQEDVRLLESHETFLKKLDANLFNRLAVKCLGRNHASLADQQELHKLGVRIALILGTAEMMKEDSQGLDFSQGTPRFWAFPWICEAWPECEEQGALLHTDDLWVDVVPDDQEDIVEATGGQHIAALYDQAAANGIAATTFSNMQWEICLLDPAEENILDMMKELLCQPASSRRRSSASGVRFQVDGDAEVENHNARCSIANRPDFAGALTAKRASIATWNLNKVSTEKLDMQLMSTHRLINASSAEWDDNPGAGAARALEVLDAHERAAGDGNLFCIGMVLLSFGVGAGYLFGVLFRGGWSLH